VLMPLPASFKEFYGDELATWVLHELFYTLFGGPNLSNRFWGPSKRYDLIQPALVRDLFQLLDKDQDGHLSSFEFRPFMEIVACAFFETPGWCSKLAKPWMPGWGSEEEALEIWGKQFREFCESREMPLELGLPQSEFVKYVDECRFDIEVLFFANASLRAGPPSTGHHITYEDLRTIGSYNDDFAAGDTSVGEMATSLLGISEAMTSLFEDAYKWNVQAQAEEGSPRLLQCQLDGVELSVLVLPQRQSMGLPGEWKLIETSPRCLAWELH